MTNEAAIRLRLLLDSLIAGQAAPRYRRDYANDVQRAALAAERRATVERIRAALVGAGDGPVRDEMDAILDEEAK
jgi:hypothetical protein